MQAVTPALLTRRFRTSAAFRLISYQRLTPAQKIWLGPLRRAGGFYGVLEPCAEGRPVRAVDRATARLLLDLSRPRRLPEWFRSTQGDDAGQTVARLVLDGVIQIEDQGGLVSGPAAHPLFFPPASSRAKVAGSLSAAALAYGESLRLADVAILADRLYRYNTEPATPALRRNFTDTSLLTRRLKPPRGTTFNLDSRGRWLIWVPPHPGAEVRGRRHYKLYLSPKTGDLPAVSSASLRVLRDSTGLDSAKVGAGLYDLIRPDKFVAYFARKRDLLTAARRLQAVLRGIPAQGVPFTARLDADGLLSWGAEPASHGAAPLGSAGDSWRSTIVTRLASGLAAAFAAPAEGVSPSRFAQDRLSLDGISPITWAPERAFFAAERL